LSLATDSSSTPGFLFGRQFVFQDILVDASAFSASLFRGDGDGGESFTRDRVAQGAAVEIDQTQIQLFRMACEEACQQLVGITQTNVNIAAGVAAFQPFQVSLKLWKPAGTLHGSAPG
jgi:hypothetical protein